jgi:hypothetical protein
MAQPRRGATPRRPPPPPPPPPTHWPDGKHRSWTTVDAGVRRAILTLLHNRSPTEEVLRQYPRVTIGTLAAVKAQFSRRR